MNYKNNKYKLLRKCALFIGGITIVSGLTQMVKPDFVLTIIGGEQSPGGNHSFAIVGMFMTLFGALLIHVLNSKNQNPIAVFWCTLQKLGASIAVTLGVIKGLFSALALAVAGFDLLSFILMFIFWRVIKRNQSTAD